MQYVLTSGGLNPPRTLAELLEEVNHATPKQVFFFDSRPFLGGDLSYAVNWTDTGSCPNIIPIFLNPKRATAEVVGHELMHAWTEFFLGFEDERHYVDRTDQPMTMMVNIVQSMVLDCVVLREMKRRDGFNCDQFRRDLVEAAIASITPYERGMMHVTPFGQLVGAENLAVPLALPEFYELRREDKKVVQELWKICRRQDPAMAWVAEKYAEALRRHGFDTCRGSGSPSTNACSRPSSFLA